MSTLETNLPGPTVRTFGDTILFTWNVGKDRVMKSLWPVADWLQRILYLGLYRGLALRGAVSVGEYLEAEDTVIGPAVADAAAWYEQADWFGAMLTPALKYHLITAIDSPGLSDMQCERWFVEYDVPLKGGGKLKQWVVAWPYLVYASKKPPTPRATLATILWSFPKPKGTESKYENSFRFFEWYGHEVFPRVHDDNSPIDKDT